MKASRCGAAFPLPGVKNGRGRAVSQVIAYRSRPYYAAMSAYELFGTKGGKPRDTTVVDREKTLQAVNHALKIAMNNNGKLVDKPNLHSAIDRYRNIVKDAGLTGKISPHSLRYAYSARRRNIICREVLAKRKPKRWFLWIWGTGTGAGIMWREFITKESLMTISLL